MNKKRILVLGYFGFRNNQLDGQTVKTRSLFELCSQKFENVTFFDTYLLRCKKKSIFELIRKLMSVNTVLFLPGVNGLGVLGFLILFFRFIRAVRVYYFVVGGWLPELVRNNKYYRFLVQNFDGVFLETPNMVNKLKTLCNAKVAYFPNFRWLEKDSEALKVAGKQLKAVALSRIIREKGMDTLLELGDLIIKENCQADFSIDIYGPISDDYGSKFVESISDHPVINYQGVLEPKEIIKTLKKYDIFLFPTFYEGEGFPGALVDAFLSGLPVIATDWKYNSEILDSGVTGFLFQIKNANMLYEILKKINCDRSLLNKMKQKAFEKGSEFTHFRASKLLGEYINS